jgi:DNA-directed RNA polymerase subunit K/omega
MKKISIENLLEETNNIYESVVIMAKRARQINNEQKLEIDMNMDTPTVLDNKENEDYDDVEIDREALLREYKKFPKPSRVAIQEMAEKRITFNYKETEGNK